MRIDGYLHHKKWAIQCECDKFKNQILELYNIPLLHFAINGGEKEMLVHKLMEIIGVL